MKSIPVTTTHRMKHRQAAYKRALSLFLAALLVSVPLFALAVPTSMRVAMVVPKDMQLYPLKVADRDAVSLLDLVYESLFELDDSREPVGSLAESWSVSSDGKTWLFTLREGVTFHDGQPLTAYDVAATMDAIKLIANDATLADNQKGLYWRYPGVDGSGVWRDWTAEDARTLRVRSNNACYTLLYSMTFPVLQAQSVMDQNPPGTGPYRIQYYAPGDELWLVGNESWWKQPPQVREITGVWFENDTAALRAFESEDVDILMTRSTAAIRYRSVASNRTNSYDFSTRQLECLMINTYYNLLKDANIRQAIAYAINTSRLETNVYQKTVTPTLTLQAPGTWLYNEDAATAFDDYGYMPDKARQILDAAGWNRIDEEGYRYKSTESGITQLTLRLNYYDEAGNALRKEAANEIATMLRAVGIRVIVSSQSFETAQTKLKSGDYHLYLCAYNFDVTPDPNFILLSNGYGNYARYRSDEMGKLCQNLRKAFERDTFKQTWMDIQTLMARDVPFIPLYWRNGIVLTRYAYSSVRDIREFELLKSIESYK